MTGETQVEAPRGPADLTLERGCILCGGDLAVRILDGVAHSVCGRCSWISRPHLLHDGEKVHVVHRPAGLA